MQIKDNIYDNFDDEKDQKDKIYLSNSFVSNTAYDWCNSIFSAFVLVIILLTFCFRLIEVKGTSMEPTLINTDRVIVTNLFYTPHDGDVVVISHGEEYAEPLIKRIIATEGQSLKIDFETGEIYVDGVLIEENYTQGATYPGNAEIPSVVPEGKVFVLGDNREVSLDSRSHEVGLIDVSSIIGKAQLIVVPHKYSDMGKPKLDLTSIRYIYK